MFIEMQVREYKMTDIEKIKIDILRDSLKDAIDTIRVLDRKIIFLASFNGMFLGLLSTLFFKQKVLSNIISELELFYCILGAIGIVWIAVFIYIMIGITPKINPIDVFIKQNDKYFSNNIYFIFTDAKKSSLELDILIDNYNKIDSYTKIQKLLYKEIGKISYIRDVKLKNIKLSVMLTWMIISISSVFFMSFILYFNRF